ncbi:MAG: BolA/IbaG family iron-sulfur metabolism protein [Proteobacteria bacterium]|nr:BolA/IbaG family iron-sulfur metabolism protein [Pseudomonadota bacterium]
MNPSHGRKSYGTKAELIDIIRCAIEQAIPLSRAEVTPGVGPGHFNVTVRSSGFAGQAMVQAHRLVYSAIAHLMRGERPPVHAIDLLRALSC